MATEHAPARSSGLGLPWLAAVAVCILGFAYLPQMVVGAPIERTMGPVQKIFYYHVPCAWLLMMSTFVCAGGSIAFLFKGSQRGDRVARTSAELAVLFGICTLVTGPLWGRVAWGAYWVWDARLTSSLLLWLIMVAYVMARRFGGSASRKLAASLAIFAAADVPLVYLSVHIWKTIHPKTTVVPTLGRDMMGVFFTSVGLFTLLWVVLFVLRGHLEKARDDLDTLALDVEDHLEAWEKSAR